MLIKARDLMRESWTLYKNNFLFFIKIAAWLLIPAVILTVLPALDTGGKFFGLINIFSLLVYLFTIFFLASLISIALVLAINGLLKKERVDMKAIYNASYSKIISYIWISVLVTVAILGGTLLLIIPGIIFSIWFSFSLYILILSGSRGTQSLSESRELVKGYFWPVLWRWVAPYFVFGLLLTVIFVIPVYLIGLAIGNPMAGFAAETPWWADLISSVFSILTVPLFTIIGVLLYNSLKKEKESTVK